jgi:hypothetical protein
LSLRQRFKKYKNQKESNTISNTTSINKVDILIKVMDINLTEEEQQEVEQGVEQELEEEDIRIFMMRIDISNKN